MTTTHARGFCRGGAITSISTEDATPFQVFERVSANVTHFGSEIENLSTVRDLDGRLVGIEFDATERPNAMRMWHRIAVADDAWPGSPAP